MTKLGQLIVFEGADAVGKTTLSLALVKYLRALGIACDYAAFPGVEQGTIGKHVHLLHHDLGTAGIESIDPTSLQLLHVAAHIDAIETKIVPALSNGRCVILDRFWWSTRVYGALSGARPRSLRLMIELEMLHWDDVRPTCVFLLRRDPPEVDFRTPRRKKITLGYQGLAAQESPTYPVHCINNDGTIEETLSKIVKCLDLEAPEFSRQTSRHVARPDQLDLPLNTNRPIVPSQVTLFKRLSPAKPTSVYDTYWRFAAERQAVFFRRVLGGEPPLTEDPILQEYKFTNAYRASDRVSQYLIRHVIYNGPQSSEEVFFRVLLFKLFNRIDTWELLNREVDEIRLSDFSVKKYDSVLTKAMARGSRVYSAAYIMPSSGPSTQSDRKHRMHLSLLEKMLRDEVPARIAEAPSMDRAFELLRGYRGIGSFLAYQYVIDLNYSAMLDFSEMEFVVPGPGARDGIRKCFHDLGGLNEAEVIRLMADRQDAEFERLGLKFKSLWGRGLQLVDCQNLFCEVDKYARVKHPRAVGITGRVKIKQKYQFNPTPIEVWYPPKWGLNDLITDWKRHVSNI